MVEPKIENKQDREDNFPKEHQAALGMVFQLVRYLSCVGSLWIFGSFVSDRDWLGAAVTFPIMLVMLACTYSQEFLLQIQTRTNLSIGAKSKLDRRVPKFNSGNYRLANPNTKTANLSGADLSGIDLSGIDLSGADLRYANLRGADLRYANLRYADLSGTDLSGVELRYANLSGAEFKHANLSNANLKHANLSNANLNCTLLNGANFSDANLSGALLFFLNLREVINLEPFQLKGKPSPFLCNVALPYYSQRLDINPNRACAQIPQLLSDRYHISIEEALWIADEAQQHRWS